MIPERIYPLGLIELSIVELSTTFSILNPDLFLNES
jgi:hypothetical protein